MGSTKCNCETWKTHSFSPLSEKCTGRERWCHYNLLHWTAHLYTTSSSLLTKHASNVFQVWCGTKSAARCYDTREQTSQHSRQERNLCLPPLALPDPARLWEMPHLLNSKAHTTSEKIDPGIACKLQWIAKIKTVHLALAVAYCQSQSYSKNEMTVKNSQFHTKARRSKR